ncbi:MAG TPA: phosphoenolpyruvate synthase, partial [Methanotrichaceae archaeon]|nr:phosphoenolpyruvate synthase [Methanotrichaceae archaeon]
MTAVVWLEEVGKDDVPVVGGKGASLGEMINVGAPVPGGFAVTAQAYRDFINRSGIADDIFEALKVDVNDTAALNAAAEKAKDLVLKAKVPKDIEKDIRDRYLEMCKREGEVVFVAVRSSATAEDLPDASFAGQQETFLNMKGEDQVFEAVQKCWASLYGARAIFYRVEQGFEHEKVNISVTVQKMINSEKSGVMFSSHPSTGEPQVIIEAAWGLGEAVVSGSVSPDNYVVDREKREILTKFIAAKEIMIVRDPKTGETVTRKVPDDEREKLVLSDEEIFKLSDQAEVLEKHYGIPQDIEWAFENGEMFILQSRPITTIGHGAKATESEEGGKIILTGLGASPGVATGKVKLVTGPEHLDKITKGDIMVTVMTTPDMVPAMKRGGAIVTDEGGMTCHAAIVSRELGCPAVVGTKKGTKILFEGMLVTVDGGKGKVYEGSVKKAKEAAPVQATVAHKPITATEIKVNVSMPDAAEHAAATMADGVGLLRIEHVILGLGKTPSYYINAGEEDEYIGELVKGVRAVAEA